jgi:hypothetical protein
MLWQGALPANTAPGEESQLIGRVVDHTGQPAAGATVVLIRPVGKRIRVVDSVVGEGADTGILDPAVARAVADEQGRYRIADSGDARALGVSAPTLHFWTVPIPAPGEELTVRLPEPTTLRFRYAIDGDAPELTLWLHLKPPEDLSERLWVTRNVVVANHGEAVLRDATPGEYTLWRSKILTVGEHRWRTPLEHRTLSVQSGHTAVVDFIRSGGGPIAGTVAGREGGGARMIFVGIESVSADAPAGGSPRFPLRMLDIVACDEGGRFETARIPPGAYVAHAAGYRTGPRYEPFGIFNDAPDFTGSTRVTVPPDGSPPAVRVELTDRHPKGQPGK